MRSWDDMLESAAHFGADHALLPLREVQDAFIGPLSGDPDAGEPQLDPAVEAVLDDVIFEAWSEEQVYCDRCDARITGATACADCADAT